MSIRVGDGELVDVIGPNGVGKSTLFHLITGHLSADEGSVVLQGRDITALPADSRARLGMAIAFQAVRLFRGMTVLENVMLAATRGRTTGLSQRSCISRNTAARSGRSSRKLPRRYTG